MIKHTLIRRAEVLQNYPLKASRFHLMINDGTLPPPINIGPRTSVYSAQELDAVMSAYSVGYTDDQIKKLVLDLVEQRKIALKEYLDMMEVSQ